MPRSLSATGSSGHPSDRLTLFKASFALAAFLATLLAGISTHKMLTWRGEKPILTASRFAAGVILGTAMLDLLSESDVLFNKMGRKYPLAFLLSCSGYLVAMLADCILARAVSRLRLRCFRNSHPKFLDKMMLLFVRGLRPTKCYDATLPVGTSTSDTKDCDGIGYLRCLVIYRATLSGDGFFLTSVLGVLSMFGGFGIGFADTETKAWRAFSRATLHSLIYIISSISILLRLAPTVPFDQCLFLIAFFSVTTPGGAVILMFTGSELGGEAAYYWPYAILSGFAILLGFCSGVMVYLSTHHLLADGYELERSVSDTRFNKFVAVVCGIGLIAAVKVLDVY